MTIYAVPVGVHLDQLMHLKTFDDQAQAEVWAIRNEGDVVYEMRPVSMVKRMATIEPVEI